MQMEITWFISQFYFSNERECIIIHFRSHAPKLEELKVHIQIVIL